MQLTNLVLAIISFYRSQYFLLLAIFSFYSPQYFFLLAIISFYRPLYLLLSIQKEQLSYNNRLSPSCLYYLF